MLQRAQRRPGAAYSLPGGGRCRGGPNDILPPKQEGAPSPSPDRSNPAKAPTGSELQPHRAQSTMYPASSCPRYHLRTSTADYVASSSSLATLRAPHRNHFSALATRYTPLFYPQDPSFPPPSSGILCRLFARGMTHLVINSTFAQPALPPFTPALPHVFSTERDAYLGGADFLPCLPGLGRATRSSTPKPSLGAAPGLPP